MANCAHGRFDLEGVPVDTLSTEAAVATICADLGNGTPFAVHTLNLDHIVKLRHDVLFRKAYSRARYVLADGFPIVLAGRMRGHELSRSTGSDLIEPLCREAASRGLSVMFYGSTMPGLAGAARELARRVPGLQIAGAYAPGVIDPTSAAPIEGIDYVRACAADICFLALGAPKQEIMAARMVDQVNHATALICIGAGLDFISGRERRAPAPVRAIGAEWLWRLASDPLRLTRRYIDCLRVFPSLFVRS